MGFQYVNYLQIARVHLKNDYDFGLVPCFFRNIYTRKSDIVTANFT
jgi:hypothetical protein